MASLKIGSGSSSSTPAAWRALLSISAAFKYNLVLLHDDDDDNGALIVEQGEKDCEPLRSNNGRMVDIFIENFILSLEENLKCFTLCYVVLNNMF